MILTGPEIQKQHDEGKILIDPWDPSRINPNSYNLSLHNELFTYCLPPDGVLDMRKKAEIAQVDFPESGLVLQPGKLYLGRTAEKTETHGFVPMLEGRSSIGRLGLFIHVTAGFGDVGFAGFWTLEIAAIHPIRIYPGVEICQIFYHEVKGDIIEYKSKKYQNNQGVQPSLLYTELNK